MIPSRAFFLWLGPSFPWINELAIRSSIESGGFKEVVLWVDHEHNDYPGWDSLAQIPELEIRQLDLDALVGSIEYFGQQMMDIYNKLSDPSSKSNIIRHAAVFSQGGVYLDTDTICLKDMTPILNASQSFAGYEKIVFPHHVRRSKNPLTKLTAQCKGLIRDVCRRLPHGWALFNQIQGMYASAANVAVLGSEAKGDFMTSMLERMVTMPADLHCKRNALGPHLIQEVSESKRWDDSIFHCYPPEYFYPLGPEISEHWFRETKSPEVEKVISDNTFIVHWYASVRTKKIIPLLNPSYVAQNKDKQLFSALASRCI